MSDKRFYVIFPKTVQMAIPQLSTGLEPLIKPHTMETGRLLAQSFHIGRKIENFRVTSNFSIGYEEVTTITLSVRNTKELRKVSDEIKEIVNPTSAYYAEFHDENIGTYGTTERVHTATVVGPIEREMIESAIGHLELFS